MNSRLIFPHLKHEFYALILICLWTVISAEISGKNYIGNFGVGVASNANFGLRGFSSVGFFGKPNVEYIAVPIVKRITHHHVHHFVSLPKRKHLRKGLNYGGRYANTASNGVRAAPPLRASNLNFSGVNIRPLLIELVPSYKACPHKNKVNLSPNGLSGSGQYSSRKGDINSKNKNTESKYIPSKETVELFKRLEKLGF